MLWRTVSRSAADGGEYPVQEDAFLNGTTALARVAEHDRREWTMTGVAEQTPRVAFVSVEAAARFLGISRGMAYQQAHEYLNHGDGLRCVRIGNRLLVPVAWLEQLADLPYGV